ncbi:MAG: ComGF family competence protein [Erysipelotrichaceae bacterium]|nr:ComGF family competence protein [Erysipelotrichaceae bacterium]MDY5252305.1 hypothetical protein [Erysipelotrichaceae bacterium]
MGNKRGSTYIDTLIVLLITLAFLPLSLSCFKIASHFSYDEHLQNEIGILQLRNILALSQNIQVTTNTLTFKYAGKIYELYETNERLILTPGTQIILCDIQQVYFNLEGKIIYINYVQEDKSFKKALMVA